jgi:hypothetical protein
MRTGTEAGNRLEKKQSCGLFSAKGCGKSPAGRLFIVCYILSQILGQYWAPPPLSKEYIKQRSQTPDYCILGFCGINLQFFLVLSFV